LFVFIGDKSATIDLLPSETRAIEHCFVPLKPGRHALPHVQLTSQRDKRELLASSSKRYVFVLPATPPPQLRVAPN
jgi:hypothetical protein